MIKLEGKELEDCLLLRNEIYNDSLSRDGELTDEQKQTIKEYRLKLFTSKALPIDERCGYLLDMKCGLIFEPSECKHGIFKLHNHYPELSGSV